MRALRELLATGMRAVSRYTGTLLVVFLVQLVLAMACAVAVAVVLAQAFAHLPMFDEAVDGDLVALIWCVRHGKASFLAIGGIMFAVVLLWGLVAWFLAGGLYGVFAERPEGRADTARCFGASGASTYLAYARLALCSLPGWIVVLFLLGIGLGIAASRVQYALTPSELVVPLVLGVTPALLVLHLLWTVSDYARIELTLRSGTHRVGVIATYLRTFAFVIRRPITLVHGAIGWVLFLLVTIAYAYLAQGHPMYGTGGAILLLVVRQGVGLLRFAIRVGILAGQVELGRTRPLPPRRVELKADHGAAR